MYSHKKMVIEIDEETKDFVYLLRKVEKNVLEEFVNELKKNEKNM